MAETTCKHCGQRIVWVNLSWRPGWAHQPAGAAFQDGQHTYCQITRAEPKTTNDDEGDATDGLVQGR